MFSGEQAHQLDAKNRIRIPSQFKLPENEEIVFCKGTTPCIYVLPKSAMDKIKIDFFFEFAKPVVTLFVDIRFFPRSHRSFDFARQRFQRYDFRFAYGKFFNERTYGGKRRAE